ncbi:flagellar basal body protein [Acidithiobacillus sp. AMEEHan]|uniref:flagellar basal body protein n=1 Tax=Acidithiobacillus sp. AMEEHan TaxID=2994951 RepID=UPI0027E49878|nr:flagellar basal body protein [Acidithiobacillus sp. AMEEHan]
MPCGSGWRRSVRGWSRRPSLPARALPTASDAVIPWGVREMSGVSGLINTSLTGLQAAQQALQVTGNNIANVNTPGYSQETVIQSTTTPAIWAASSTGMARKLPTCSGCIVASCRGRSGRRVRVPVARRRCPRGYSRYWACSVVAV